MQLVYHAKNSTDDRYVWIDYWTEHSGKEVPENCPCCGEPVEAPNSFVGAHVRLSKEFGQPQETQHLFVTPTCNDCNNKYKYTHHRDEQFVVEDDYLVDITHL